MKVKDEFTEWDLDLVKSLAKDEYLARNISIEEAWVTAILGCLHAKGFDIVKSEREPTWSKLTRAQYAEPIVHPNWWKKNE